MKITLCKLSKNVQRKLLEFFVLEVTAPQRSGLVGRQSRLRRHVLQKNQVDHHMPARAGSERNPGRSGGIGRELFRRQEKGETGTRRDRKSRRLRHPQTARQSAYPGCRKRPDRDLIARDQEKNSTGQRGVYQLFE